MRRVELVGLGCRVSRADLDALAEALPEAFALCGPGESPDVVVVGTCTVTADADAAGRQALRRAAREHPGAAVVAAGCGAERCREALAALPGVAAVVGPREPARLVEEVVRLARAAPRPAEAPAPAAGDPRPRLRHARPVVKLQDGCDQRCAYCVVPLARGPSRSLPFEDALARLAALGDRHRELVLTGVHLGAYGRDLAPGRTLSGLVHEAVRRGLPARLRLSSIEPPEFPLDLLDDAATRSALCPHFHLPLQTGSDRLLAAMGRPYRAAGYATVVERILERLPGAAVGADLLCGFPGETDHDHRRTLALVEALPLAALHVFPFSPRPGTAAAGLPDPVPPALARERAAELREAGERRRQAFLAAGVGREAEVVVERCAAGLARGTSGEGVRVTWPAGAHLRGDLCRVRIASAGAGGWQALALPS